MSTGSMVQEVTKGPADRAAVNLKEVGQFADWWANPSVVGLMGFALTTIVTGLYHALGFGPSASWALALAFGGTAQFIAGFVDLRKGVIFGGSAFISYGAFWWAFALIGLLPTIGITVPLPAKLAFFVVWTLFTLSFCIAVVADSLYYLPAGA